tara:strand:+ start:434 stop:1294 length:861 start_codon:yes stop_codon:yes gene_type:complete
MSAYKRFSNNSAQPNTSYQVFNQSDTPEHNLPEHNLQESPSPKDLQKDFENFKMQQKQNSEHPQPHEQFEQPTLTQQPTSLQLMKQKQEDIRRERMVNEQEQFQPPPQIPQQHNYSLDDLRQQLPNTHEVYIHEVYRLLQNERSLSLQQAVNLAEGNGCFSDGFNQMCPSRPKETFKQRGDCSNGNCSVKFNTNKETYQEDSVVDKIKGLGQITFYSSTGCGFCKQSKQLFEDAGLMGGSVGDAHIRVLENQPLPEGVRGYPHFVRGNKSHTGFPRSLERFYELMS